MARQQGHGGALTGGSHNPAGRLRTPSPRACAFRPARGRPGSELAARAPNRSALAPLPPGTHLGDGARAHVNPPLPPHVRAVTATPSRSPRTVGVRSKGEGGWGGASACAFVEGGSFFSSPRAPPPSRNGTVHSLPRPPSGRVRTPEGGEAKKRNPPNLHLVQSSPSFPQLSGRIDSALVGGRGWFHTRQRRVLLRSHGGLFLSEEHRLSGTAFPALRRLCCERSNHPPPRPVSPLRPLRWFSPPVRNAAGPSPPRGPPACRGQHQELWCTAAGRVGQE